MADQTGNSNYREKIALYDKVEILVNEKKEMEFEGVIDAVYIALHYERIVRSSRHFDIVKMIGYRDMKIKEVIAEVIIGM